MVRAFFLGGAVGFDDSAAVGAATGTGAVDGDALFRRVAATAVVVMTGLARGAAL